MGEVQAQLQRLVQRAMRERRPCMVCSTKDVAGIGTWVPDPTQRLAAGGNDKTTPIFAFWLCRQHLEPSDENDKAIRQAVLRSVRVGNKKEI